MRNADRRAGRLIRLLAISIVLAYAIPYGPLRGVALWQGPFLFWVVFGIVAIGLIGRFVAGWRP